MRDIPLLGTELVVLAVCETGMGELRSGEGIFGLRRAFQIAGAEAVLMSLHTVPESQTMEMLNLFYGSWLGGMDKYAAFEAAQKTMAWRYDAWYWAGFVLVGRGN